MTSEQAEVDPEQQGYKEIEKARKNLEELENLANQSRGPLNAWQITRNTWTRQRSINEYGEKSVLSLLQPNSRNFMIISFVLNHGGINTKQDLIDMQPKQFKKMWQVGSKRRAFIFAMRNLAVAENRVQGSNNPQV